DTHTGIQLLGLLDDAHNAPALFAADGAGLHDFDRVADATRVILVVRLELGGATDDLAVQRMTYHGCDSHYYGLRHLVAHHASDAGLAPVAVLALALGRGGGLGHGRRSRPGGASARRAGRLLRRSGFLGRRGFHFGRSLF